MIVSHSVNWNKTCINVSNRLSKFVWEKDLAHIVHLSERQVQNKLTGHPLTIEELYIFSSLLDCSIEDLLVFDHDEFVEPERAHVTKHTEMELSTIVKIGNIIDLNAQHKRNCDIQNLAEFLLYLPLMPEYALCDVVYRCDDNLSSYDRYYLYTQMNHLYKTIPCDAAKEYADSYRDQVLRVKGDGELQFDFDEYARDSYALKLSLFAGHINEDRYKILIEGLKLSEQ